FDGKCIRENLGAIVTLLDVEEGVPVAVAATTVGKGGEVACAHKLLQSDQVALENTTLIADSLHTNGYPHEPLERMGRSPISLHEAPMKFETYMLSHTQRRLSHTRFL